MTGITNNISSIFYPRIIIYSLLQNNETIISRMKNIFEKDNGFSSSNDVDGEFTKQDFFKMNVIYHFYTQGAKFSSTLHGKITKGESNGTDIEVRLKPGLGVYIFLSVATIFGIAYLIKFLLPPHELRYLFYSLTILIIGILIPVWIYKVSNAVLLSRFLEILRIVEK